MAAHLGEGQVEQDLLGPGRGVGRGAHVHDAGVAHVDERAAGHGELQDGEGGEALGVGLDGGAGQRERRGGAGQRQAVDGDRHALLGEQDGRLEAVGVVLQRAHRAVDDREDGPLGPPERLRGWRRPGSPSRRARRRGRSPRPGCACRCRRASPAGRAATAAAAPRRMGRRCTRGRRSRRGRRRRSWPRAGRGRSTGAARRCGGRGTWRPCRRGWRTSACGRAARPSAGRAPPAARSSGTRAMVDSMRSSGNRTICVSSSTRAPASRSSAWARASGTRTPTSASSRSDCSWTYSIAVASSMVRRGRRASPG